MKNSSDAFGTMGLVREYLKLSSLSYTAWNSLFDPLLDQIVAHCRSLLALSSMAQCKYLCWKTAPRESSCAGCHSTLVIDAR